MRINILTLFPEMFDGFLTNSIIKRALTKKVVEIKIINIRDFTLDKYRRVDTPPIGGGAGLIMKCQPIVDALKSIENPHSHKILMSPKGKQFNQQFAVNFAKLEDLTIVCGHYEGVYERGEQVETMDCGTNVKKENNVVTSVFYVECGSISVIVSFITLLEFLLQQELIYISLVGT